MLLAAALVAGQLPAATASDVPAFIDLGRNAGAPPAHFDFLPAGREGRTRWMLAEDPTAADGFAIEQRGAAASHSLAIYKAASLKNADISLRIKATRGAEGRAGLALRLAAQDNYYLVQLDAPKQRVLFSHVTNGLPEEIVGVDADIATNAWHWLAVRATEDEFVVTLDGAWIFTAFDNAIPHAGRIALWSAVDGITRFDSITIAPLSNAEAAMMPRP
jgi:hypothetical protein